MRKEPCGARRWACQFEVCHLLSLCLTPFPPPLPAAPAALRTCTFFRPPPCPLAASDPHSLTHSLSPPSSTHCAQNLHVVLCFSPIGSAFRERLRQFPSLVNCCTIDW